MHQFEIFLVLRWVPCVFLHSGRHISIVTDSCELLEIFRLNRFFVHTFTIFCKNQFYPKMQYSSGGKKSDPYRIKPLGVKCTLKMDGRTSGNGILTRRISVEQGCKQCGSRVAHFNCNLDSIKNSY